MQPICINGRFGDVFRGIHKTKGEVALKRLRIGGAGMDEEVIRRFEREADTWRRLKHPHVLEFLGTYKPEAHIYFVSPFAKNGTLLEYVSARPGINRVRLLWETSDAVDYLHRENVVHGDIKASNLLISDNGHVLLCDFGLAKPTHAQTSTALKGAGTLRWQSPELWNNEPRSFGSDVYAFAMTIVEMMTGKHPYHETKNSALITVRIVGGSTPEPKPAPRDWPNGLLDLVRKCWVVEPKDRPDACTLLASLNATPTLVRRCCMPPVEHFGLMVRAS
ncbi:hypothetical protein M407DRAFT_73464 [Tulasnella calospora MUT 4182]|uniref:Protein kinase domain-containing protein n=1 Tax=Tulasnella calospora MUT 4182 TaxID=1051891 RepID=A0A0C3QL17_9AGAM|nr:hypothetical protein M407DRAFT_73464 [Tulasnella calospora MUT 4182]